jgi:biotin carboxyl carrier protein
VTRSESRVTADARRSPSRRQSAAAGAASRSASERQADHAAIDRLTDELVPALIAKLSASNLGEIEVGEGDWTIRLRRPPDGGRTERRSATDRGGRTGPGHPGHGHAPGGFETHRAGRESRGSSSPVASTNGSTPASDEREASVAELMNAHRAVATSPAVGIFQPRPEAKSGTRVRAGDRLGAVDMLGVPQEVVAPADGIVGASLVEPGEAVEFGQELVVIELAARSGDRGASGAATGAES